LGGFVVCVQNSQNWIKHSKNNRDPGAERQKKKIASKELKPAFYCKGKKEKRRGETKKRKT
jgi:hypothetical protein